MEHQPQQRFCTNCGQTLTPGAAFCVECGTQVTQGSAPSTSAPGPFSTGAQPGKLPPYAQAPAQTQDDPLQDLLVAGMIANQMRRRPVRRVRRRSRIRGCSCLLLVLIVLAVLVAPFVGLALTTGRLHQVLIYVAGGMVVLFCLVVLIGMLATRGGREALFEGILDGLFGGG